MLLTAQTTAIALKAKLFRGFSDPSRLSILECLLDDNPGLGASDSSIPPQGSAGYYYLVRAVGCGENGSYDSSGSSQQDSRDVEIDQSASACP